ncbi:hypothetical protein G9A89_002009 [Geosiphon pyriformis]|nr:hypothetical protein G9A89_002009 [Geosiphon pyriformis]
MLRPMPPSSRSLEKKLDKQPESQNLFLSGMATGFSENETVPVTEKQKGKDIEMGVAEASSSEKKESYKNEQNGHPKPQVLKSGRRVGEGEVKSEPNGTSKSVTNSIRSNETLHLDSKGSEQVNGNKFHPAPNNVSEPTSDSKGSTTMIPEVGSKAPEIPFSGRTTEELEPHPQIIEEVKTGKRKRTNSMDQLDNPVDEIKPRDDTGHDEDNILADDEAEAEAGPSDTSRRRGGGDPRAAQDYRCIEEKFEQLMTRVDFHRHWEEKFRELENEKNLIEQGSHIGFLSGLDEITRRRKHRDNIAMARKSNHNKSADEQLNLTQHRANCELMSRKVEWRKGRFAEINSRRWKLQEDKKNLDNYARVAVYTLPDRSEIIRDRNMRVINVQELAAVQEEHGFPADILFSPIQNYLLQN